jgi:glycosyltransferase involved in cell wall biosynthesis
MYNIASFADLITYLVKPIQKPMAKLEQLTIITITYNNPEDLIKTYDSLKDFRANDGTHIVINGGNSVASFVKDARLIEEPDSGIYDAINKGISHVNTHYFMLINSGDFLVEKTETLELLLKKMKNQELDFLLNDCSIEFGKMKRIMKSSKWEPWMFKFGAQPPHPPIIYRTKAVRSIPYDINHPVIADFKYLEELFKSNLNWSKGNRLLVHMSEGGATSSGLKSFFYVNKQFRRLKGPVKTIIFILFRPIIKIFQML